MDYSAQLPDGTAFPMWEDRTHYTRTLFVDGRHKDADDGNPGDAERPLKTIGAAARLAEAGTEVVIREGVYRESVAPVKGGTGEEGMICYRAAEGEKVIIKASVPITAFSPSTQWHSDANVKVWEIAIDPEDFKGYNPFCAVTMLHDRSYLANVPAYSTFLNRRGMVFVDGKPLKQVTRVKTLTHLPGDLHIASIEDTPGSYWVEANGQKIHIRLSDDSDPHDHEIEITNREQCFAPSVPFLSYIHLKGLTCAHAAMGAPVPQRGAISAHRGHHWIIEGCTVEWANAVGIDCGNECWNHPILEGQILGHHILRGNTIRDAGVCGIACYRSTHLLIEDNLIEGTGWQRMESAWESAGIKVHHAWGALFRRNVIRDTLGCSSLWMDWGNFNCRLTGNLFLNGFEAREHIFLEYNKCAKGIENLIDNNILWNVGRPRHAGTEAEFIPDIDRHSEKQDETLPGFGIYTEGSDRVRVAHNLIGKCRNAGFYAKPTAFLIANESRGGTARGNAFHGNLFYDCGEAAIKMPNPHNASDWNVFAAMRRGGYLRVAYPLPTQCLDLDTWQEFFGFDLNSCLADMDIALDEETLTLTFDIRNPLPDIAPDPHISTNYFTHEAPAPPPAGP
ncbi:MAG: right-handed parallel beta-helix repeat-containing protein, partial [Kiritimatiellaeota bacterium]|nr:right-handed parallel beta-helix repeat-containing protein [Kiritimatiellota bacterium]